MSSKRTRKLGSSATKAIPDYAKWIRDAITHLADPRGSSRASIRKYIEQNVHNQDFKANHLRAAFNRGLADSTFVRGATTARFCIATKTAKQDGAAKKRSKKHTSSATEKKGVQKTKADQGKADKADVKPHEKAGLKAPLKVFVYADASAQMNGVDEACFLHAHPPPEVERLLSVLATADYERRESLEQCLAATFVRNVPSTECVRLPDAGDEEMTEYSGVGGLVRALDACADHKIYHAGSLPEPGHPQDEDEVDDDDAKSAIRHFNKWLVDNKRQEQPFAEGLLSGPWPEAVRSVTMDAEVKTALRENKRNLVVVDFWADWCGPCMRLAPQVEGLALANPQHTFLKANFDKAKKLASHHQIECLPTFLLFKHNKLVERLEGTDIGALQAAVKAHG